MSFSDKLTYLMNIFGLNNSALGRSLDIDPSMISRWKSGERKMGSNSYRLNQIARYFIDQQADGAQREQPNNLIENFIGIPLPHDYESRVYALGSWLIDYDSLGATGFEMLIIDQVPVGIAICKCQNIVYANNSFVKLMGYEYPKEIIGIPLTGLIDTGFADHIGLALNVVEAGQRMYDRVECQYNCKESGRLTITFNFQKLALPDGSAVVICAAAN